MSKIYIIPGDQVELHYVVVKIGPSGSVSDLEVDWTESAKCARGDDHTESDPNDEGIGIFLREDGCDFTTYLEDTSGRLWYDDEEYTR